MTDTNLTQRKRKDWLDSTTRLVKRAREMADEAAWFDKPNAERLRREADMLEARYGSGETVTPRF